VILFAVTPGSACPRSSSEDDEEEDEEEEMCFLFCDFVRNTGEGDLDLQKK
jgi:hypothetical protein